MANRAIWSVRRRHEWLATPLKKNRNKRRSRLRIGQEDALQRKAAQAPEQQQPAEASNA